MFQHFARQEELGEKVIAYFKSLADDFHRGAAVVQNRHGISAAIQDLFGYRNGVILAHICDSVNQLFR